MTALPVVSVSPSVCTNEEKKLTNNISFGANIQRGKEAWSRKIIAWLQKFLDLSVLEGWYFCRIGLRHMIPQGTIW